MTTLSAVQLDNERPHRAGQAECVLCRHVWTAVALAETSRLECPTCRKVFGVWQASLIAAGRALDEAVHAPRYLGEVEANPREAWLIMAAACLSGYFYDRGSRER